MKLGWKIVLGSFIGFFGAAFGSIGGVGGGGIFVPMLTLIIGFDPKSSAAMSKCEDSVHLHAIIFLIIYPCILILDLASDCIICNEALHILLRNSVEISGVIHFSSFAMHGFIRAYMGHLG